MGTEKQGGFFPIKNAVIDDGHIAAIGASAWAVYSVLVRCANNTEGNTCFPSYDQLQVATGMSRATVSKALRTLLSKGYVTKEATGNSRGLSNTYRIQAIPSIQTGKPATKQFKKQTSSKSKLVQKLNSGSLKNELKVVQKLNPINKHIKRTIEEEPVEAVAEKKIEAAAAAGKNLFQSQEEEQAFRVWFKEKLGQRGKDPSAQSRIARAITDSLAGKGREPNDGDLEDLEAFRKENQKKSMRAAYFEQQEREFKKILEISKAEGFTAGYKYAMSKRLYAKVREWPPFKEWLEDPNRPKKSA